MTSINRRASASNLGSPDSVSSNTESSSDTEIAIAPNAMELEVIHLDRNGWVPNNNRLPVLLYRRAFDVSQSSDPAALFEQTFQRNGWPAQWRNDVYSFHHYHCNAHEILGFVAGTATLTLGGTGGRTVSVSAGDVIVLPAGTGHRKTAGSADFLAVGAYPLGQQWDTCCSQPTTHDLERIHSVAFPNCDPVAGPNGPLIYCWSQD